MRYILFLLVVPVVLHASCGPIDDDDSAVEDDDDVTPDPACTDGWEPLAILDAFEGDIVDYSVDPVSSTLAAITERYLFVYDLSEPRTPTLLDSFDVQDLVDPTARWLALSVAEGGHAALSRWEAETGGWAHVQLIEATAGSANLGLDTTFSTGEPDEYGQVPLAVDLAAHGARSVVVSSFWNEARAYFLEHQESGVSIEGSRTLEAGYWGSIAFTGDAMIAPGTPFVRVVWSDASIEIAHLSIFGLPRHPAETEAGWLIPTMAGCLGPNALYRLSTDLTAIEQIGETEDVCDKFYDDGAHQLAVYEDEIFVANGSGRLIRGAWTPDDWITVEGPGTLSADLWGAALGESFPSHYGYAGRVERFGDTLVVGAEWYLGLVRICPL